MRIIVGESLSDKIKYRLSDEGFGVICAPRNQNVMRGLDTHPDMQIAFLSKYAVCEPNLYVEYSDILKGSGISLICGKSKTKSNYPYDIAYNIKTAGNNIFHNFKYTDENIIPLACGMNFVDVPQGYSGCSICIAGSNAIITADTIIHKRAVENNIKSLLVSPGNIELPLFDTGFIGGASFYHDGILFFFGDISTHPDYKEINRFCHANGTEIFSLGDGRLFDCGSAFTID